MWLNYDETNNNIVQELLERASRIHADKFDKLKKVADDSFKPLNKLKEAPKAMSYKINEVASLGYDSPKWFMHKPYYGDWKYFSTVSAIEDCKSRILGLIDRYVLECQVVFDQNIPLIEENKAIIEKLGLIMKAIGIPEKYTHSYYKTNRSSTKTSETKIAGWREDVARNIQTQNVTIPDKSKLLETLDKEYKKAVWAAGEDERKAKAEKEKDSKENTLAMLRVKYTPDNPLADIHDIRDEILAKDKYLHLSYWLERNRGDWSEGYNYAEIGIDSFEVVTTQDREIYDEISGLIEDWDGDGRCFRDCKWNYGVIYDMCIDHELKKDLETAKSMCPE
jgi:hypothetical protein